MLLKPSGLDSLLWSIACLKTEKGMVYLSIYIAYIDRQMERSHNRRWTQVSGADNQPLPYQDPCPDAVGGLPPTSPRIPPRDMFHGVRPRRVTPDTHKHTDTHGHTHRSSCCHSNINSRQNKHYVAIFHLFDQRRTTSSQGQWHSYYSIHCNTRHFESALYMKSAIEIKWPCLALPCLLHWTQHQILVE